jgi:cytochrome c biogenesis protein CcmG, thiol:disulfide interchange protein DsbE
MIAVVAGAVALAACAQEGAEPGRPKSAGMLLPEDRLALPQFDLASYEALIAELQGKPVVVNFWGSWCPPCTAEAPDLADVSREYEGRVQFVGVDILDAREPARDFILRYDWQYPSVFDPTGEIRDGLGYIGQPITLVYDRNGDLAFEWTGVVTAEQLRTEIDKLL